MCPSRLRKTASIPQAGVRRVFEYTPAFLQPFNANRSKLLFPWFWLCLVRAVGGPCTTRRMSDDGHSARKGSHISGLIVAFDIWKLLVCRFRRAAQHRYGLDFHGTMTLVQHANPLRMPSRLVHQPQQQAQDFARVGRIIWHLNFNDLAAKESQHRLFCTKSVPDFVRAGVGHFFFARLGAFCFCSTIPSSNVFNSAFKA